MSEKPSFVDCDECEGEANTFFGNYTFNSTVKGGTPKFYKNISDMTKIDERWINKEIDVCKKSIRNSTQGASPYSTMDVNYDVIVDKGTQNPAMIEHKQGYRRKTMEEVKATDEVIQTINEVARKKSNKDFK